jgi:hypothetical protein
MFKSLMICERCWFDRRPGIMPIRVLPQTRLDRCYACASPTISGIFVRVEDEEDPATGGNPSVKLT